MKKAKICLAAGCFWGVEAFLRRLDGVLDTDAGYAGGHVENPSYEEVCTGTTGHTEVVMVEYDQDVLPLSKLLDEFLTIVDATGTAPVQYRSGIYPLTEEDMPACEAALLRLSEKQSAPVTVQLRVLSGYSRAEDYHQDYMEIHPDAHCHVDLSRFGDRASRG